jgi:hypothetical protein
MAGVRKLTVSELIRETKPDWEPVRKQEKRASTRPFSGAPQVTLGDPTPLDKQLERFDRLNQGSQRVGRTLAQPSIDEVDMIEGFDDMETVLVDDSE